MKSALGVQMIFSGDAPALDAMAQAAQDPRVIPLLSDLDALCERITTAEKRFREGPQKVIHTHRAA